MFKFANWETRSSAAIWWQQLHITLPDDESRLLRWQYWVLLFFVYIKIIRMRTITNNTNKNTQTKKTFYIFLGRKKNNDKKIKTVVTLKDDTFP